MKIVAAVVAILGGFQVSAQELNATWVQYTGTDIDCASRVGVGDGSARKNVRHRATSEIPSGRPSCHFKAEVRAVYDGDVSCPSDALSVDGGTVPMQLRTGPAVNFNNTVCSYELPREVDEITLDGTSLPLPKYDTNDFVIMGDSGCRMGQSHFGMYQECRNPSLWPFKRVSDTTAHIEVDLIVHVGDYIYREGPCSTYETASGDEEEVSGCAGTPFYDASDPKHPQNYEVWYADFFGPARNALLASPWMFIRGNHELCKRAGQGFFRYLHHGPVPSGNEVYPQCEDGAGGKGPLGIATDPWLVEFEDQIFAVLDTSQNPPSSGDNLAYYAGQLDLLTEKTKNSGKEVWLTSHYPYYGWGAVDDDITGENVDSVNATSVNEGMRASVAASQYKLEGFDLLLGSHIHLTQVSTFEPGPDGSITPPQLIVGNSGTQFVAITEAPADVADVKVKESNSAWQYGFVRFTHKSRKHTSRLFGKSSKSSKVFGKSGKEQKSGKGRKYWEIDFKDQVGRNMVQCQLNGKTDLSCHDDAEVVLGYFEDGQ